MAHAVGGQLISTSRQQLSAGASVLARAVITHRAGPLLSPPLSALVLSHDGRALGREWVSDGSLSGSKDCRWKLKVWVETPPPSPPPHPLPTSSSVVWIRRNPRSLAAAVGFQGHFLCPLSPSPSPPHPSSSSSPLQNAGSTLSPRPSIRTQDSPPYPSLPPVSHRTVSYTSHRNASYTSPRNVSCRI